MIFERFIARRYLISKHKVNFITIISIISVLGITIGVAALIVVLSVFNGFGSLVKSFLVNFDPHVRVEILSSQQDVLRDEALNAINSLKNLTGYSPFVSGRVLAVKGDEMEVITLKGLDEKAAENIYGLKENIMFGSYGFNEDEKTPGILLGLALANRLEAITGDTITVISPVGIEKSISQFSLPMMQKYIVKGIYSSNNNEYDRNFIFTSLKSAQRLLGYGNRIQGFDIRLNSMDESDAVKQRLEQKLSNTNFHISTWYDFHKELYTFMQIERWGAYILLSLIIAVASFNILGSLSMSVIEKKRDIGILVSMGAEQKSILKIFMYEGLLIGIIGTLAGVVIGYGICYIHMKYNIYPLDPMQYKINAMPLDVRISDFFFITGVSMLLSFFASLFPAKRAAKINPLEAIKWE